jgi:VIT1/CCC1 family predicted Fe2+/Mn2+ transporter
MAMASDGELQRLESRDWSELIQKTIDDGTRVVSAEMRLFEKNVRELLDAQTDRVLGTLAVMAAIVYGAAMILVGAVFLLHLLLPLWLSLIVIGAATATCGIVVQMVLSRRAADIAPSTVGEGAQKPIDTLVRDNNRR